MKILNFGSYKFMVVEGGKAKVIFIHGLFDLYKIDATTRRATKITELKKLCKFIENGCMIGFEVGLS